MLVVIAKGMQTLSIHPVGFEPVTGDRNRRKNIWRVIHPDLVLHIAVKLNTRTRSQHHGDDTDLIIDEQ